MKESIIKLLINAEIQFPAIREGTFSKFPRGAYLDPPPSPKAGLKHFTSCSVGQKILYGIYLLLATFQILPSTFKVSENPAFGETGNPKV